jgi:hypothetical protein
MPWRQSRPLVQPDRLGQPVPGRSDPGLVLVVAGPFIWPFAGPLGLADLARAEAPFTFIGRRQGRPWICGMHPGGAQRRGWPARTYALLIVAQARGLGG